MRAGVQQAMSADEASAKITAGMRGLHVRNELKKGNTAKFADPDHAAKVAAKKGKAEVDGDGAPAIEASEQAAEVEAAVEPRAVGDVAAVSKSAEQASEEASTADEAGQDQGNAADGSSISEADAGAVGEAAAAFGAAAVNAAAEQASEEAAMAKEASQRQGDTAEGNSISEAETARASAEELSRTGTEGEAALVEEAAGAH